MPTTRPVICKSDVPGVESRMGQLLVCDCGCDAFGIFQIDGQEHVHFMCKACQTGLCPDGACSSEAPPEPSEL
jgi:hypothetical protein